MEKYKSDIVKHYDEWRRHALRLAKDTNKADDLLHEVLLKVFTKDDLEHVRDINKYVGRSITIAFISPRSAYNYKFTRISNMMVELNYSSIEVDTTDYSARINNEQLDIYIGMLPFFEREVFYLYALNDFSYDKLSLETGIPKKVLQRAVCKAKEKLTKSITYDHRLHKDV